MIRKKCFSSPIFNVEEVSLTQNLASPKQDDKYYRLNCGNWVNILALTDANKKAVLITQYRIGAEKDILETAGGLIETNEVNDPTLAAARELEEETGYTSNNILSLGESFPNPAIQTNKIYFFLALNSVLAKKRKHHPDPGENIKVHLFETKKLEELVRLGRVEHCLSALCILLSLKYIN